MRYPVCFIAVAAVACSCLAEPPPVDALLKDLKALAGPGSPGAVMAMNEHATPLVLGSVDDRQSAPVVVAAEWGKGRIVAFGHSAYIDDGTLKDADTGTLMQRCITWAGHDSKTIRLGVVDGGMDAFGPAHGFTVQKLGNDFESKLAGVDVLVIGGRDLTDDPQRRLEAWLKAGGGMIVAQTGWGWQQIQGGLDMRTNTLNRLLLPAGIAWTDEIIGKTAKNGFDVARHAGGPLNFTEALNALVKSNGDPAPKDKDAAKAREETLAQASAIATRGVRLLPEDDTTFRPALRDLITRNAALLTPNDKKPLTTRAPLPRFLIAMQIDESMRLPADKVTAHHAAATFPGAVPSDAPRITREVPIDTRVKDWHSTGLYAAPGEVITVTLPPGAKNLSLRIGCHTDHLWHAASWKRIPEISRSWKLKEGVNTAASAFGGLVYIDVDKTTKEEKPLPVTIANCVAAPLFVLGKTSVEEWKSTIRSAPGPWAELACDSVIVTVPSSAVRDIDDPTEICTIWQSVLDNAADLATIPHARARPERYVADVQISAGYMHSGYPIMTHLDAADDMSQAAKLRAGSWGLFHELGHNHQQGDWTFEGTGEVTNNLWSLYLMETIAGKKPGQGHEATSEWARRHERAQKYLDAGADFDKWKSDPFLALEMYLQLREAFGWEPFKQVFAQYRTLKKDEHPKTDQEKRDQWMVRMSRAVGKNLGAFFVKWGVPTTQTARDTLKDLPDWKPENK